MDALKRHGSICLENLYKVYDELIRTDRRREADEVMVKWREIRAIVLAPTTAPDAARVSEEGT